MSNLETAPAATEACDEPAPKRRSRVRYNRVMKVVRRAHLYAGLFMTPWVFLYGVTALLFNHPEAFPDATLVHFGASETSETPLAQAPRPEALAARVVDALNANAARAEGGAGAKSSPSSKSAAYRLMRAGEARYAREFFASLKGDGQEHTVRIDLANGEGSVRSQVKESGKPAPFVAKGGVKLTPPPLEPVTRALPALVGRLASPGDYVVERTLAPDLSFLMEGRGQTWRVTYNPQTGLISGRPEAEGGALTTRMFLLRLHVAHHYPNERDVRWFWALAVDAMFVSMVGWGITGLLMWWQMKNVRTIGIVVLIASAVAATALAVGMHRLLAA